MIRIDWRSESHVPDVKMTGSPVFRFNSNLTKKQKIQRKLSFVRDVPRNQLRLHIDNLLTDSEKNSDSQDEKEIAKPSKSVSSFSSFVFENKKGVKRKLDFDANDVNDEVGSYKYSNHNISLNGFRSRNSSLGDVKSITISPSKNRHRRSSCTRSSVASTCRRRLFADGEPDAKKLRLESPILCTKPKRKEIKLSLKKRFPGVPNSDAARSGLLLNLAFSKYNMLNNDNEENVSVDFVDQNASKSSTKKELLQYSSIKKNSSAFHFSPVFKAMKKVKRKLNLEEQAPANKSSADAVVETSDNITNLADLKNITSTEVVVSEATSRGDCGVSNSAPGKETENESQPNIGTTVLNPSPISVRTQKSPSKYKTGLFKNSRLRLTLKNEIFNLSKPGQDESVGSTSIKGDNCLLRRNRFSSCHPHNVLAHRNSSGGVRIKPAYDRIIINKDTSEDQNSSRTDGDDSSRPSKFTESTSTANKGAKRWFDDSFHVGKRLDMRKSLFCRRQDAFLDSHIQRFLNDCAQAAELGVLRDTCNSQISNGEDGSTGSTSPHKKKNKVDKFVIEDVESPDRYGLRENEVRCEVLKTNEKSNVSARPCKSGAFIETKSVELSGEKVEHFEEETSFTKKEEPVKISADFIIEDSTSQEINRHCVEEVELVIENADSQDGFAANREEDWNVTDNLFKKKRLNSIFEETVDDVFLNQMTIEEESAHGCSQHMLTADPDLQVEEISSSESISEEIYFTKNAEQKSISSKDANTPKNGVTFDSGKKSKRKKYYFDGLVTRLERLLCREKSDTRMWEYEMSKQIQSDNYEYSMYEFCELKHFGTSVSNSVMLIVESTTCPKTLTYSSVIRIHPPWNILLSKQNDKIVILRPCKIEVVTKDVHLPLFQNQTLPNVVEDEQFCLCSDACNCTLPDGYQTVIQPLLHSTSYLANFKTWRTYDDDYFTSSYSINDVILKHKLISSEHLFLDLRVLQANRNFVCEDSLLWNVLCLDKDKEICCIIMKDEIRGDISFIDASKLLRFHGILPWKLIPSKILPSFINFVEFHDVPEIEKTFGTTSLYVFVMSKKHGRIEHLD